MWGDKQRALWYVMVFSGVVNYICLIWSRDFENARAGKAILIIDLVTVFHAILTGNM